MRYFIFSFDENGKNRRILKNGIVFERERNGRGRNLGFDRLVALALLLHSFLLLLISIVVLQLTLQDGCSWMHP